MPPTIDRSAAAFDLMARGKACVMQGDTDAAEGLFREALDLVRGSYHPNESAACGNLGSLYGVLGRRFEAVLLFRRGLAIGRVLDDPALQARHLSNIAAMFVVLDLWEQVAHTLAELELAVADVRDPDERQALLDLALWSHASLAVHLGRVEEARVAVDAFRAWREGREDVLARVTGATLEADLLLREGRPVEALAVIEGVETDDAQAPLDGLYLRAQRMAIWLELGREGEALAEAERILAALAADVRRYGLGELSVELATDVGDALARSPEKLERAREAYDLAASIVLARLAELDACARAVPELSTLPEEDRAWIAELRRTYHGKQTRLLEHVSALLHEAKRGDAAFLYAGGHDRSLVRICAWCSRVGTRDGRWLPLAHYVPSDDRVQVTHCICEPCAQTERMLSPGEP